jgi:hypothetical protein
MSAQRPPRAPRPAEPPTVARPPGPVPPSAYREPLAPAYGNRIPPTYGEPLPEDPRWWERGWMSAALAALAALIVGFVVGLLVGESSSTKTARNGAGPARTVTVTGPAHTTTVTHVVVHTHTVTTAAPASGAEGSNSGGRTYTGSGNGSLGTITVARQSMLHWRSSGGFSIRNSPEDEHSLAFNSSASSGESPVEPGTYHLVTVAAPGEWSFTLSPG